MNRVAPVSRACHRCAHYYITFDPRFPYGCHAMGFKSRRLPEIEIRTATGHACLTFAPKSPRRQGRP